MALVCIQCSMRAMLKDEPSPTFEETTEQHLARCHSDPAKTKAERAELERLMADKLRESK